MKTLFAFLFGAVTSAATFASLGLSESKIEPVRFPEIGAWREGQRHSVDQADHWYGVGVHGPATLTYYRRDDGQRMEYKIKAGESACVSWGLLEPR